MKTKELKQIDFEIFSNSVKEKRVYIFNEMRISNKTSLKKSLDSHGFFDKEYFFYDICWKNLIFFGSKDKHSELAYFSNIKMSSSSSTDILNLEACYEKRFVLKSSYSTILLVVGIVVHDNLSYLWLQDSEENIILSRILKSEALDIKIIE